MDKFFLTVPHVEDEDVDYYSFSHLQDVFRFLIENKSENFILETEVEVSMVNEYTPVKYE